MKTNWLLEIFCSSRSPCDGRGLSIWGGLGCIKPRAEVLRSASHVILSGMGSSLCACIPWNTTSGPGGSSRNHRERRAVAFSATACHGAVVVLVSRSGESVEIAKLLPLLKAQGVTIIG